MAELMLEILREVTMSDTSNTKSALDLVAEEAILRAIDVVARNVVNIEFSDPSYTVRTLLEAKCKKLLETPEFTEKLKTKLAELIDGLPASMPAERRRGY